MPCRRSVPFAILFILACLPGAASAADKAGCKDHPLFPTRMPGYVIEACDHKEFDRFEFSTLKPPRHAEEGRMTFITYAVLNRADEASAVAVVRNYENAIKQAGGTVAASEPNFRWVNGSIVSDDKEVWVQADKGNGKIWLRIIEKQAMVQHVVADAAAFGKGLAATGHVMIEGIYFDTGKAEVKPESLPALQEIAKLLAGDAALKIWVVGHTDAVGTVDDNMRLSQARADAVVKALVTSHGVAAARLKGFGVGPLAPVASNGADEGRAKNRRVELVKQ